MAKSRTGLVCLPFVRGQRFDGYPFPEPGRGRPSLRLDTLRRQAGGMQSYVKGTNPGYKQQKRLLLG